VGEAVSCIHAGEEPSGCGTSELCKYCGAVNAIIESQKTSQKSVKETSISSESDGHLTSLDLNVTSTPILLANHVFYVLSLQDISNEKQLLALERVFLHDLLNTAGGLNGLLNILKMGTDPEEERDLIDKSEEASRSIVEELILYRQLRAAEKGDIQVNIELVSSRELLASAIDRISFHEVGQNKQIVIDKHSANVNFHTDRILLQRVIINLLKNAMEATPAQGLVKATVEDAGDKIVFRVKNSGVIHPDVQGKIFHRSFSTKGIGRGNGTYSVRLITENYLKGKVTFVSNEDEGTIFIVELDNK
jgi:signal transduction histidine kinase